MSMHKKPLTPLEHEGLRLHGLDIGTPSQLSDCFRHGVAWALESMTQLTAERDSALAQNAELAAHVSTQGLLLRSWQTWLGASREQCDAAGQSMWSLIDAAVEGAPHLLNGIIKDAYLQGFAVSREGFNGDVTVPHLAPDGLTVYQLADRFAAKRGKV